MMKIERDFGVVYEKIRSGMINKEDLSVVSRKILKMNDNWWLKEVVTEGKKRVVGWRIGDEERDGERKKERKLGKEEKIVFCWS